MASSGILTILKGHCQGFNNKNVNIHLEDWAHILLVWHCMCKKKRMIRFIRHIFMQKYIKFCKITVIKGGNLIEIFMECKKKGDALGTYLFL